MEAGILVMLINNKAIYVDKQSGMFFKKNYACAMHSTEKMM